MDFFQHQEAARKKTKLLVFYFLLAVIFIIAALNFVAFIALNFSTSEQASTEFSISQWLQSPPFYYTTIATLGMIALGSLFRWFQLRGGGKSVAQMVNAREVLPDTNDRLERRLINVVEEMALASGMPVPTVYIMDQEEAINAFVAGQEASDTVLVVTRGTLEQLTRQELQGVVAHEFSHIFNADMKLNVNLISILAGILVLGQAGYFITRSVRYSNVRSNNKDSGNLVVVVIIVGISMYIIGSIGLFFGRLIKAAISRQREFLADASAIQYARDNEGLANAFLKIAEQSSLLENRYAEETSHMCIAEPIKLKFNGLATHPPLEARLDAIMPDWQHYRQQKKQRSQRKNSYNQRQNKEAEKNSNNNPFDRFGGLVETVGNPTTQHIQAAILMLESMPQTLKSAAHNHHAETHAMHLALALLLCDQQHIEQPALQLITETYGPKNSQQVASLAKQISKNERQLRLATLDLAIPSIRRLSLTERKQFLALLKQIIQLDKEVTQFEYVLYSLLRKSLQLVKNKKKKRVKRFATVIDDIQLVLSAVVHSSGHKDSTKKRLFSDLMLGFTQQPLELLETKFNAEAFNRALENLSALSPMLKKPLLNALEEAIKQDSIIHAEEVELLRAIAEYLDCPMPPLVRS